MTDELNPNQQPAQSQQTLPEPAPISTHKAGGLRHPEPHA
jgi:hypothetical protein